MVLKFMRINEVTKGISVDREEDKELSFKVFQ